MRAPRALWASGLCWAVMFTTFMIALTMTAVANVLVTMALAPLLTALFARVVLRDRLSTRTWAAIALSGLGITAMFVHEMRSGMAGLAGMAVALAVPVAAASNWTLLQKISAASQRQLPQDMLPAVLIGALISAFCTAGAALPWQAGTHDLLLLAGLGFFQLALPCLLVVRLSRELPAPQIALLGLLEVLFGVLWAWLGAGEVPTTATLGGGAMVLAALAANELLA